MPANHSTKLNSPRPKRQPARQAARAATRRSQKRPHRRPQLTDVQGHLMDPATFKDFEHACQDRAAQGHAYLQAKALGLSDVLAPYRPSTWAKHELMQSYKRASAVAQSIASMGDFNWHANGAIRAAGVELLEALRVQLAQAVDHLDKVREALRSESSEKLQDWQSRRASLGEIHPAQTS